MTDREPAAGRRWEPSAPVPWWRYGGVGLPRSLGEVRSVQVVALLLVGFTVWGYADIRKRGVVAAGHPELHRTDVTVFTEAGAAFFDGRDPYTVVNPRGWTYLYPPLFGLMAAPLAGLDAVSQTVIFYAVSVVLGYAAFLEARRLWRRLAGRDGRTRPDASLTAWIVACGGLTAALPTLECLQRGQVGIALAYVLLLGLRLAIEARGPAALAVAGVVLAWPAAVKLIPALPVGFLVWHRAAVAVAPGRTREDVRAAAALGLGVSAGLALFLLVIPAALLGWDRNLGHLRTWAEKVVRNDDAGRTARFHIDSTTNQGLPNAAYRLAATVRPLPLDERSLNEIRFARTPGERQWARDRATAARRRADTTARRLIRAAQGLIAVLLLALGLTVRPDDATGQAAAFGLACLAMLLLSPVAWTHYHMMALPAVLFVPLWLAKRGRVRLARAMAAVPAALVWSHFVFKPWAGPVGLLGLGLAAWFLAAAGLMVVARRTRAEHDLPGPHPTRSLAEVSSLAGPSS